MIIHIALFKWKSHVSEQEIDWVMREIKELKDKIPEVIDLYCGKNFSQWSKDYTHAVVVKVKDRESLSAYRSHPSHIPVAKKVEESEIDSIGIDFEV